MSASWTPGPWQVMNDYLPGCLTVIADVDGEIHSDGSTTHSYTHIATCEDEYGEACLDAVGNARLIASAPTMAKLLGFWAALDGGAWHAERYASEKAELLAETKSLLKQIGGEA